MICLLIFRDRGRERERNMDVWEKHSPVTSHMCPDQGSNPQPRPVSWSGIQPTKLQCMGQHSTQLSNAAGPTYRVLVEPNVVMEANMLSKLESTAQVTPFPTFWVFLHFRSLQLQGEAQEILLIKSMMTCWIQDVLWESFKNQWVSTPFKPNTCTYLQHLNSDTL